MNPVSEPNFSDRNLLFGILALQMDFVDQAGLVAAMQAWTIQKSRPLGELLVELGHMLVEDRSALEVMVDRHVQRHGGRPDASLAALSSVSSIASELCDVDDADLLQSLGHLPSNPKPHTSSIASDEPAGDDEKTLTFDSPPQGYAAQNRYELLRQHAEGALGRVWIARDLELNREVAFKEIKPKQADDANSRGRFVLEAEITGGLEHPGIVPVYGLGHFADGRPFYAMRFIRGASLKEAIQKFHSSTAKRLTNSQAFELDRPFRNLIQRLIDVCNAVAYAHSRGVLHRDLKPGNIMLGNYGETLVVDWGLAKTNGRSFDSSEDPRPPGHEGTLAPGSSDDVAPTQMGSVIGTPQFMSPEQASGRLDQLGPATDVYSLGATLYQLLVGQPPIGAQPSGILERLDKFEVLRRVARGEFPAIKTIRPAIPAPLAAVCQRAMQLEPDSRYESALQMADDLEHWLTGDAVSAWREPIIVRSRRWVRRHQTLVTSAAAALLVSIALLTTLSIIVTSKNRELAISERNARNATLAAEAQERAAVAAAEEATKQRLLAEQNADAAKREQLNAEAHAKVASEQSQLAMTTLTSIVFDVQRSMENLPGGMELRQRVLTTALEKLDQVSSKFVAQSAKDLYTMVGLIEMADTIMQLGGALPSGNASLKASEGVRGVHPNAGTTNPNQASEIPELRSATQLAERLYRRASEIAQSIATKVPDNDIQAQRALRIALQRLGYVFVKLGHTESALQQYEEQLKFYRKQVNIDPSNSEVRHDLSITLNNLGDLFLQLGRPEDAFDYFEEGLKINRGLVEADPNNTQLQRGLMASSQGLGKVLIQRGRTESALQYLEDGVKISRQLADNDPGNSQAQRDLFVSLNIVGDSHLQVGRLETARQYYEDGLKIGRQMTAADPNSAQGMRDLSASFHRLSNLFMQLRRWEFAQQHCEDGLKISRKLANADPSNFEAQHDLSVMLTNLGDALMENGRLVAAIPNFEEGLMISRRLAEADSNNTQIQREMARSYSKLGNALFQLGRLETALVHHQDGLKIRRSQAEAYPDNAQVQRDLLASLSYLGDVLLKLGRMETAFQHFEDSLKISRGLAESNPNNAHAQRDLWAMLNKVGDILTQLGRIEPAREHYEDGLKISCKLVEIDPSNTQAQRDLWMSYHRLGELHLKTGRIDQAMTAFDQGIQILDRMIANNQLPQESRKDKANIEQRRQFCIGLQLAMGDWETLLQAKAALLPALLAYRATEMLKRGEFANALTATDTLCKLEPRDKNNLYNAACVYALYGQRLSEQTGSPDKPEPTAAEKAERQKYVDLALETLRQAVAAGWDDFKHLRNDTDLTILRGLPEFESLFPQPTQPKP